MQVKDYFDYLVVVARKYDSLRFYPVDEYLLVRSNPWLIDTLANTDYYLRKDRGEFVPDQKELVVLYRGDLLRVPDSAMVCALQDEFGHTLIDGIYLGLLVLWSASFWKKAFAIETFPFIQFFFGVHLYAY